MHHHLPRYASPAHSPPAPLVKAPSLHALASDPVSADAAGAAPLARVAEGAAPATPPPGGVRS